MGWTIHAGVGLAAVALLAGGTYAQDGPDDVDRFVPGSIGVLGDVGIGTLDPDRTLDVTGPAVEVEIDSNGGGDGPELVLTGSTGAVPGSWAIKYRQSDGRFSLYRDQDPEQEAISVDVDGRLGIGTKTPDRALDVTGPSAEVQVDSTGNDGAALLLTNSNPAGGQGSWSVLRQPADGRLSVVRDPEADEEYLSVTADGSVGIGTSAPSARLEVAGAVRLSDGIRLYGCGTYVVAGVCPIGNVDGPSCDDVPAGGLCESDGECDTSNSTDNCGSFDWFYKISE